MARIAEIHERLLRWQEWYFTSAACGLKSPAIDSKVDRSPRIGGFIAYDESEALETDCAVAKLPVDLRAIVRLVYLDPEQRTMEMNAAILHMNRKTLYRKLELSDRILREKLESREE